MELILEDEIGQIVLAVIFRKRKTLEIRIKPPNRVEVVAPKGLREELILATVRKKTKWIREKLDAYPHMKTLNIRKVLVDGENFLYLGEEYSLEVVENQKLKKPRVEIGDQKLRIETPVRDEKLLGDTLEKWYRERAKEKITERVAHYQNHFTIRPKLIQVKEQKRRWGSCTGDNKLLFNWRCIMAPLDVLDYVVVHEMCHMVEKNHSKRYWALVQTIMPDYERKKLWLKNTII